MLLHLIVAVQLAVLVAAQTILEPGDVKNFAHASPPSNCEWVLHRPDVRSVTVRFDRVKIPPGKNVEMAQVFKVPNDQEYHLIGSKFLVENKAMVHHIIVHSCDEKTPFRKSAFPALRSNLKNMGCTNHLTYWNIFFPYDRCFYHEAGFSFGKGVTGPLVQIMVHLRNEDNVVSWDSSGVILYFTPKLRKYDLAMTGLGQNYFALPPHMEATPATSTCSSRCTKKIFTAPIRVTTIHPHMHGLGVHQNVTVISPSRNMTFVYSYDAPTIPDTFSPVELEEPLLLLPGDEVQTKCTYNTMRKDHVTTMGYGADNEMCYTVLYFFPKQNKIDRHECTQYNTFDQCDLEYADFGDNFDCRQPELFNASSPVMAPLITKMAAACSSGAGCSAACRAAGEATRKSNLCFRGQWWPLTRYIQAMHHDPAMAAFGKALDSCNA